MPRKKNYTTPVPLGLSFLNDFEKRYPDCCNEIKNILESINNSSRIIHKDLVKYEANSLSALLRVKYHIFLLDNEKKEEEIFLCLYGWQEHKQIFNFDKDLFEILIEQATDHENIEMPYETILHPFFPTVYVNNCIGGYAGFFVFF